MSVDQSWAQLCAFSEGIPHHVTTTLASQAGGLRGVIMCVMTLRPSLMRKFLGFAPKKRRLVNATVEKMVVLHPQS